MEGAWNRDRLGPGDQLGNLAMGQGDGEFYVFTWLGYSIQFCNQTLT